VLGARTALRFLFLLFIQFLSTARCISDMRIIIFSRSAAQNVEAKLRLADA
jgi:hypothetical protein